GFALAAGATTRNAPPGFAGVPGRATKRGPPPAGQRNENPAVGMKPRHELGAQRAPSPAAACEGPRRAGAAVVARSGHDGGVSVEGECDGVALRGWPDCTGADQLSALLRPGSAAACEYPRRADIAVVARPAHDAGVAGAGPGAAGAWERGAGRAGAHQLRALLSPAAAAVGEHPNRSAVCTVERTADNGGAAVAR